MKLSKQTQIKNKAVQPSLH